MRDNYQGGSLAGYVVVAVLLALALIGGLYGVQRYNASRDAQDGRDVAKQEGDKQPESGSSTQKNTEDTNKSSDSDSKPATVDKKESPKKPATSTDTAEPAPKTEKELPTTGPVETTMSVVSVGALAFAVTSYLRSRRLPYSRD